MLYNVATMLGWHCVIDHFTVHIVHVHVMHKNIQHFVEKKNGVEIVKTNKLEHRRSGGGP